MPKDQPSRGCRMLLVEDDAFQALDLELLLDEAGPEVLERARTVTEALALAESMAPTCAVLDVRLRNESVFPAAKVLKERGVAIIFCTGNDLQRLRKEWPDAPVVPKPVSPELLLEAICAACPCKGSRAERQAAQA